MDEISFRNLTKVFHVHEKEAGLRASVRSLFSRKFKEVHALRNVSACLSPGELVGLVGANGAGKTTLSKILAGIIHPSAGEVSVLGFRPWEREREFKRQIALIMGQKNQLWWDLPAADSFLLLKEIYQIPERKYQERLHTLAEVLDVRSLLRTQVRRLSLGERMKMELIAALLHAPRVVYLDEPTIGLDFSSQRAVRSFLKEYQEEHKAIMLLTSHYMQDIESLCKRVIIIREGSFVYDGALSTLIDRYASTRKIHLSLSESLGSQWQLEPGMEISEDRYELTCTVARDGIAQAAQKLLSIHQVRDLRVEEEDVSTVVERVMRGEE